MTDIVERLRATLIPELYVEAADEIERLRAAKRRALQVADERSLENVRLRAALREIAQSCRYDENQKAYCQTREATIAQKALASEQTVPEFPVATEEDRKIYDRCREISDNHGKEGDAK